MGELVQFDLCEVYAQSTYKLHSMGRLDSTIRDRFFLHPDQVMKLTDTFGYDLPATVCGVVTAAKMQLVAANPCVYLQINIQS
jgi:hypothetical protein